MQIGHRTLLVAAVVLSSTFLRAQTDLRPPSNLRPPPSTTPATITTGTEVAGGTEVDGHWKGAIHVPSQEIAIELDLARNANGATMGTFSGVSIKGYPLSDVVIDGAAVSFTLKVDGGGAFSGKLSNDGKAMSGEFTTNAGGYILPFDLTRSGDAKFEARAKNPTIAKELEGTWSGTLEVNGTSMRILLKMANQADGTSTGSLANLDQGGVEIPVSAISQTATGVNIDVSIVSGTFTGTLNPAGTELTGTWNQRTFSAPLNFQRDR